MTQFVENYKHPLFKFSYFDDSIIDQVFRFYEIPVLFSFFSKGQAHIAVLVDDDEELQKWSVAQVTRENLYLVKEDRLDINLVFSNPDYGFISLVSVYYALQNHYWELLTTEQIGEDIIPMTGTYSSPHVKNKIGVDELSEEKNYLAPLLKNIQSSAKRVGRLLIDLRLKPNSHVSTISLKYLGEISKDLQEFVDTAATGILGQMQLKGRVPEIIRQQTALSVYGTSQGSFILKLAADYSDLYGSELVERSLSKLGDLIINFDDAERTFDITRIIGSRASLKYQQLLSHMHAADGGFEIHWSDPAGKGGTFGLSSQQVGSALENIMKFVEDEVVEINVAGVLISGSIRTGHFEIESGEIRYVGYAEEGVISKSHEASLGKAYRAVIKEVRSINRSTGQEIIRYRLKSLE